MQVIRNAMRTQCQCITQAILYRYCLIITGVPDERFRSIRSHLLLRAESFNLLGRRVRSKQIFTGTGMSIGLHRNDRITENNSVRA
ncbi:hypothetical protein D3C74_462660 [compost metagenome]